MSAPLARTVSGSSPLTVAWVPTGMNAGVRTGPWGVTNSPQRAAPSLAINRKENAISAADLQFLQQLQRARPGFRQAGLHRRHSRKSAAAPRTTGQSHGLEPQARAINQKATGQNVGGCIRARIVASLS